MKRRNVPVTSLGKGRYRAYAPKPLGKTLGEVNAEIAKMGMGHLPHGVGKIDRAGLEVAIQNAARKFNYKMRGTLDAALASGCTPMVATREDGEVTLIGWHDAQGNVVLV